MIFSVGFRLFSSSSLVWNWSHHSALCQRNTRSIYKSINITYIFFQPIVSMFRCRPDSPHRWIFNWWHGVVGGVAFALAVANMLIGALMFQDAFSSQAVYPIIAWVAVHGLVELVFLISWCYQRKCHADEQAPLVPNDDAVNIYKGNAGSAAQIHNNDGPSAAVSCLKNHFDHFFFISFFSFHFSSNFHQFCSWATF